VASMAVSHSDQNAIMRDLVLALPDDLLQHVLAQLQLHCPEEAAAARQVCRNLPVHRHEQPCFPLSPDRACGVSLRWARCGLKGVRSAHPCRPSPFFDNAHKLAGLRRLHVVGWQDWSSCEPLLRYMSQACLRFLSVRACVHLQPSASPALQSCACGCESCQIKFPCFAGTSTGGAGGSAEQLLRPAARGAAADGGASGVYRPDRAALQRPDVPAAAVCHAAPHAAVDRAA